MRGRTGLDDLVRQRCTMFEGIENPTADGTGLPLEPPAVAIATLMPMSLPSSSTSAPPELPGLMGVGLDHRDRDGLGGRRRLIAVAEVELEGTLTLLPSPSGVWSSCCVPESGAAEDAIWIERFSALTMPVVTVFDSPSGAPIAIVWSPTLRAEESANSTGVRSSASVSLITARSYVGSVPTTSAS